jgi:2-polyprenyl-3-methyl-5-hydroxy-6-metoxy-1,4-benzoquinol methylase
MNLEKYHENYEGDKAKIEERFMTKATIQLVQKVVKDKKVLNLGLGNGLTSKVLEDLVVKQLVIEGSKKIIDSFAFQSDKTEFIESYFENFNTNEKFDVVLANHVLEHVSNPVKLMSTKFHEWLHDDGIAFITVPNAKSIHRLIGQQMGMLESEYNLNSSDIKAGHQRIYDTEILRKDIEDAGLEIIKMGGYNIKMLSLAQMKDWSQELLDAIFEVSKQMPAEICANIWVKVRKKR